MSANTPTVEDIGAFVVQAQKSIAERRDIMAQVDKEIDVAGIDSFVKYLRNTTVFATGEDGETVSVEVSTINARLTPTMIAESAKYGEKREFMSQTLVEVTDGDDRKHFSDPLTVRYDTEGDDAEMDARHQEVVDSLRSGEKRIPTLPESITGFLSVLSQVVRGN